MLNKLQKQFLLFMAIMLSIVAIPAIFPQYFGMHNVYTVPAWILVANVLLPFIFGLLIGIRIQKIAMWKKTFKEMNVEKYVK